MEIEATSSTYDGGISASSQEEIDRTSIASDGTQLVYRSESAIE